MMDFTANYDMLHGIEGYMDYRVYSTAVETSAHCAGEMVRILNDRISTGSNAFAAVSGGKTPDLLFDSIVKHFREAVDWSKVHFFWVDERCVPPDSPDSNYGTAMVNLFKKIRIPSQNIHRIIGEADPGKEAKRYADEIAGLLPLENGLPVFDLVLLGMGDDGHTASVFTGNLKLLYSPEICAVSTHPDTGQTRITLTGNILNNAREIRFLVTGAKKAQVINEIFNKQGDWMNYPASFIVAETGNLFWYLDEEAAGMLK